MTAIHCRSADGNSVGLLARSGQEVGIECFRAQGLSSGVASDSLLIAQHEFCIVQGKSMLEQAQPQNGHWRRFGSGMLSSLLIVLAWSAICWAFSKSDTGLFWMTLREFGIFNMYVLAILAQIVVCLVLARRNTLWWSAGAIGGTLLVAAGPVAVALIVASGMPAMRY